SAEERLAEPRVRKARLQTRKLLPHARIRRRMMSELARNVLFDGGPLRLSDAHDREISAEQSRMIIPQKMLQPALDVLDDPRWSDVWLRAHEECADVSATRFAFEETDAVGLEGPRESAPPCIGGRQRCAAEEYDRPAELIGGGAVLRCVNRGR